MEVDAIVNAANTRLAMGDGIDVWCGSIANRNCDAVICTIDLLKKDSEIKLLIGCNEDQKTEALRFHNNSEFMSGLMIRR